MIWYQLYKKELPSKEIKTVKGDIDYFDFLYREKERLESLGRKVKIEGGEAKDGLRHKKMYLLVNKIT